VEDAVNVLERAVVAAIKTRLAGRRVVASISGGKDSAAMSLHLRELGIEHDRVFCDTGWEAAETYDHVAYLADVLGPIATLRGERQMEELVAHKGMFPQRTRRFCTEELKVFPIMAYLDQRVAAGEDLVNAVGIRAGESAARSQMPEWEWSKGFDCEVWRPLISWSEADVIAIHQRHGVRPNPLYLKGASRVGCFPCIYARKSEIRFIAEHRPEQIVRIRKLEERVQAAARARHEARGELETYHPPTFFQAPIRNAKGKRPCMPIDEVVAWSRTAHGGRQVELFAPAAGDEGCMRWGLCETGEAA
jgi:3'-phosphoadenosine 5'-phosphosulfate sulfotransferase (PAPS reductase)/FAD synthetase